MHKCTPWTEVRQRAEKSKVLGETDDRKKQITPDLHFVWW